jgi:lipoyl(octanoyl) transferase
MNTKAEAASPHTFLVCELGTIPFPEAMEYEHRLLKLRADEKIGDVLLILEHPPTVTLGRFGKKDNVLATSEELKERGVAFFYADRGGDATFNCPGQLVVHPIVNLRLRGARAYIGDLEEMCLRVLHGYGVAAEKSPEHPGVWVRGAQICAMGLYFSRGVSMHGLSLNVNPDLDSFKVINLCGLPGRSATSIQNELGHAVSPEEVIKRIKDTFAEVFHARLVPIAREELRKLCFEN